MVRKQNYALYVVSDFCSQFAAGMALAVVSWFIIDTTGANSGVGIFSSVNLISGLATAIICGKYLRKIQVLLVIVVSHSFRAVFGVIAAISVATGVTAWIFPAVLVALANGIGWNGYFAASKELLSEMTTDGGRMRMNSIAEITMQVGLFSSGAVAGLLYAPVGFANVLWLSATLFAIAAIVSSRIKLKHAQIYENAEICDTKNRGSIRRAFCGSQKVVFAILVTLPLVGSSIFNVLLPGYVSTVLMGDAGMYGFADMLFGVGAAGVGFLLAWKTPAIKLGMPLVAMFMVASVFGVIISLFTTTISSMGLILLMGGVGALIRTIGYTVAMDSMKQNDVSSVVSIWNAFGLCFQALFSFSAGQIADSFAPTASWLLYSFIFIAGAIVVLILSKEKFRVQSKQ